MLRALLSSSSLLIVLVACAPEDAPDQASDLARAGAAADSAPRFQDLETASLPAGETLAVESAGAVAAPAGDASAQQPGAVMPAYGLGRAPARRIELAADLAEISGIAFTDDGRLLAHGDETGTVWVLDPASGDVRARFAVAESGRGATAAGGNGDGGGANADGKNDKGDDGKKKDGKGGKDGKGKGGKAAGIAGAARGDFEDVQVVGDRVWLLTSDGALWEAPLGDGDRVVAATRHRGGAGTGCKEFEGLAHDPARRSLLLLCKVPASGEWRDRVVVLEWSPERRALAAEPRFSVPAASFARLTGARTFQGSAIAREPRSGHFVLIAGPEETWIELSATGRVLAGGRLDRRIHPQPEGLAFARDGSLLVSDEAAGGTPAIAVYRQRR